MTTVRVSVTTQPTATGWRFRFGCADHPDWSHQHEVDTYPDARRWLPRPAGPCHPGCDHAWCPNTDPGRIESALGDLRRRGGDGVAVGRWLYSTVLEPIRADLDDLAQRAGCDVIELALTWPFPGPEQDRVTRNGWMALSSLPWELMRDEHGPLAVSGPDGRVAVAVTRVVAGTRWSVQHLPTPPKVLFVLGAAMTHDSVRAGAEVLGLLREVEAAGQRVNHRLLDTATPAKLRRAVAAFRPDIVHLICHGGTDPEGRGFLRLTAEDSPLPAGALAPAAGIHGQGEAKFDDWTADKLLEQLKTDDWQPPVVVLSACETAGNLPNGRQATTLGGPQLAAPFAVELVRNGIPVVVAMAGTVADRACRVFTRHFGRALASGQSLVTATAQARRMAFAEVPAAGFDWGLPAVFLAEGVDPDSLRTAEDPRTDAVQTWADELRLNPLPLFCARDRILAAFWSMLPGRETADGWRSSADPLSTLVISTANDHAWIGKTRMLEEMARQALTNGCLPLLIRRPPDDAPRDVVGLARVLADAFDRDVAPSDAEPTELRWLANAVASGPSDEDSHRAVADELRRGPLPALREALYRDAATVLSAARQRYPDLLRADARLIVLVDNLGPACVPLLSALFGEGGVDRHGLGRDRHAVPLVVVMLGEGDDIRRQVRDRTVPAARWMEVHKLEPFTQVGDEDLLVYESVLLHPFRGAEGDLASRRWVFNRDLDQPDWQRNTGFLRRSLKGLPGKFGKHDSFEQTLDAIQTLNLIVPADDERGGPG